MNDPKALVPGPAVTADMIERYSGVVPEVLLSTWRDHGLATTANGFVRLVDPATVVDLVSETTERHAHAVPLFTTAFGDIGILHDGYIQILKYRHGLVSTVTDRPEWLFKIIGTTTGREDARHLDWSPFPEAVERLGVPDADECFGYAPLLVLGGSETADKLEIVSLREHVLLITQFAGPLR